MELLYLCKRDTTLEGFEGGGGKVVFLKILTCRFLQTSTFVTYHIFHNMTSFDLTPPKLVNQRLPPLKIIFLENCGRVFED